MYRLKAGGRCGVSAPDGFPYLVRMNKTCLKKKIAFISSIYIQSSVCRVLYSLHTHLLQPTSFFFNNEEAEGCEEGFKTKETWFYRLITREGYKHFSKTKPMKVEHTLPIQEWWKDRKEIISDEVGEKSRVFTAQQLIDLDCNF